MIDREAQEEKKERIREERMKLPLERRLGKAMSHRLRAKLLAMLNTNPASASELEEVLPDPLSNIAYHVRELWLWGLIEVVDTEKIRGAMKTRYRGTTRMQLDGSTWGALPAETKDGITIEAVKEAFNRAKNAIESGTFYKQESRAVITAIPDLDKQGFEEVEAVLTSAYEKVNDIAAAAVNREPDPAKRFRATVSLLAYESPGGK